MVFKKISVVIPVAPDVNCKSTLESLKEQDYPQKYIEIFVINGNRPCSQRNLAVREAKGDLILFIDNDSIIKKDYISKMAKHFDDKEVAVVGGPSLVQDGSSFLQKCFGYVIGSYFATMSMQAKFKSIGKLRVADEKDMILCNMCMRKDVFDSLGGFNENLYPNEENELLNRIKDYKIIYDPEIVVFRYPRDSISKFANQFFNYGWGRTRHYLLNPKFFSPIFLIPSFFVLYIISLMFFNPFWYFIPLIIYVLIDFVYSIAIFKESKDLRISLISFFLFPLLHISYGLGVFSGVSKSFDPKIKYGKTPYMKLNKAKTFSGSINGSL